MILNEYLPKEYVIGSHIYKAQTYGKGLNAFGLKPTDFYNERNGLLLYESIEKLFDVKEVCFVYNTFDSTLNLKVLNPVLLTELVIYQKHRTTKVPAALHTLKFSDIDGWKLHLPPTTYPFRRILSWHAKLSIRYALSMDWITKTAADSFKPFFDTSEGASQPHEIEDIEGIF
jgi:hypothetical protein